MRTRIPAVLALALSAACAGPDPRPPSSSCEGTFAPPAGLGRVDRVVIVTIDGMRPELITAATAPTLHAMLPSSIRSLRASTVRPSLTLPSHASMVSGLPPETHGVLWNDLQPERGRIPVRTLFEAASRAGLSSALFAGKEKLRHLAEAGELTHVDADRRTDTEVMDAATAFMRASPPALAMIHLPDVDRAGHHSGWLGNEQRAVMRRADEQLARLRAVLDGIDADATRSALIVTADHGGEGTKHGKGRPTDLAVPWILHGAEASPAEIPPVCVTATATVASELLGIEFRPGTD